MCTKFVEKDLRDQQRFEGQEKAFAAQIDAARQETRKTEAAMDRRFESVNEFRAQLADQTANLMPRKEAQAVLDAQVLRIGLLEDLVHADASRRRGVSDGAKLIASVVAFVSIVLGAVISIVTLSGR